MALVGCRYIQATDPGSVSVGYEWLNTTSGELKIRNTNGTEWVLLGSVNNTRLGNLPLSGGAMSGAITGATGWAPIVNPNFTDSASIGGDNISTTADLAALEAELKALIDLKVSSGLATATAGLTVKTNIAIGTGVITKTVAEWETLNTADGYVDIPLPSYTSSGGSVTADAADCKSICSLYATPFGIYHYLDQIGPTIFLSSDTVQIIRKSDAEHKYRLFFNDNAGTYVNSYPVSMSYIIIGTR